LAFALVLWSDQATAAETLPFGPITASTSLVNLLTLVAATVTVPRDLICAPWAMVVLASTLAEV